ncbi:MAG: hypothetical protein ACM34O_07245, partial [Ignavibacteria bacterium]
MFAVGCLLFAVGCLLYCPYVLSKNRLTIINQRKDKKKKKAKKRKIITTTVNFFQDWTQLPQQTTNYKPLTTNQLFQRHIYPIT